MEQKNFIHNQESSDNLEEFSNIKRLEHSALDSIIVYRGDTVTRRTDAPMQPTTLTNIIEEIRSSTKLAATIQKIRTLDNKDEQNEIKKYELPYFTLGKFKNQYLINENFLGTKFIIPDYDDLGQSLPEVRANFLTDPYAFIVMVSPSGEGLKTCYEFDREITDPDKYIALYKHYAAEKGKAHGAEPDEVTYNPGRACYLTSDRDIYVNPDRLLLPTDIEIDEIAKKKSITRSELIEAVKGVEPGHRNDRLLRVTCALIDSGVDEEVAIELMIGMNLRNIPPLPETEVIRTVKHAYVTYPHPANLKREFIYIQKDLQKKKTEPVAIAKVYFDWLKENRKARFFTDEQINHYVYLSNRLIRIDEYESDFEALLLRTANISTATPLGRVVTQVVGASAHLEGKKIQKSTWLQTDLESLNIYLNLKNERNELLCISVSGCNVIQNGRNDADVFMLNVLEDKIAPITYIRQSEAEIGETMRLATSNIIAHIPSEEEDRWFAYAWRMSYPLFDLTTAHIIVRFQGGSEQGKTTASRLLSYSLYGKDFTDKSTVASMYSDASINPLILDDNLESMSFADSGRSDFYLGAATGGGRQKRDQSSGSGLINEKTRALVLCNGIESIAKSEHTSRMMIIQCDRSLHGSNYSSAVLLDLKRNRNRILSAEYDITQRVLCRIADGEWNAVQQRLLNEYPQHSKNRMFEHIALIVMYIEELWKVFAKPDDPWELVKKWMEKQNETATDEIRGTDPIIQALEILRVSTLKQNKIEKSFRPTSTTDRMELNRMIALDTKSLLVEVSVNDDGSFVCSGFAGEILSSFAAAYQVHMKKQFPIDKSKVLTQRILNISAELKSSGYEITDTEDKHAKQKIYTFTWKQAS